jgi:formate dehydrogenase iron-sulfur subunit
VKTSANELLLLADDGGRTLIDDLLAEQRQLTAVESFSRGHGPQRGPSAESRYRALLPATPPGPNQQYAFEVDLDKCSGCKACVTACHALNGLDDDESWRTVGLLVSQAPPENRRGAFAFSPVQQHVTTACHHCVDPACLHGCPVLAYDKDPVTGIVRHLDDQCIGCSYCVMKCPYEVPRYSQRLGIVRKCDMCSNRLAVGEPPACAQACPSEAIRITIVDQPSVRAKFAHLDRADGWEERDGLPDESPGVEDTAPRPGSSSLPRETSGSRSLAAAFLPDSPDPSLTLPTTRFLSRRALPEDLLAADHDSLRLDPGHGPLVVMLVLTQAATGLWCATAAANLLGVAESAGGARALVLPTAALAMLVVGLGASVLHLGRPTKAWRSFLGWRRSWLSREIIAFSGGALLAAGAWAAAWLALPSGTQLAGSGLAAAGGLVGVFTSSMVYIDTRRAGWRASRTFGNFFGTTFLLGATLAAAAFAWLHWLQPGPFLLAGQLAAGVATALRTALFAWRRQSTRSALEDEASPTHWNAQVETNLLAVRCRLQTMLFVVSTVTGLLAMGGVGDAAHVWASLAAVSTLISELVARSVYFAAGGTRRMPGGVA